MMPTLDARHIVITGGTGALGSAVVEKALALGAHLHIPCADANEADSSPYRDHPNVRLHGPVDLRMEKCVEDFFEPITDLWATLNIAGGFAMNPITQTRRDDFISIMQMNALTTFLVSRQSIPRFGSSGGRIVNVAARPALEPRLGAGMVAYTTSKAAVAAMTIAMAAELAPQRILVNAVAPSIMDTPANRRAMPDADHAKWPTPAHVADAMLALASPDNTLISGAVIPVYGEA